MGAPMETSYRTLTCADARAEHAGREAILAGWVNRRRDLGQLIFLDLRDRYGITQVVVDATEAPAAHATASGVRGEFVLRVTGTIARRREGTENPRLATGDVELRATDITVLAEARTPPFVINEPEVEIDEALRLKYRYLDLRREPLQQRILARARLVQAIRDVHHEAGFVEVETPLLIKSTPEGARDFIVPVATSARAASTPCPRAPSSSSSCSWSAASTATSRSPAACATRTCAATASPSSPSSTSR